MDKLLYQLTEHLPSDEIERILKYYPSLFDSNKIKKFLAILQSPEEILYWNNKKLSIISRLSLTALVQNKIVGGKVVSLHLMIGAWKELIQEVKFYGGLSDYQKSMIYFSTTNGRLFPDLDYCIQKKSFWKLKYDSPAIIEDKRLFTVPNEQFQKKVEVSYGENELDPILKKFLVMNDQEWHDFLKLMNSEPFEEHTVYAIVVPKMGCWSPFLTNIKKKLKPLQSVKIFMSFAAESDVCYLEVMLIPSFTVFKNYLMIKAKSHKRTPIQLVPQFGPSSEYDVEMLKREGAAPFGLYYSGAASRSLTRQINQHCHIMDGFPGNALSFGMHDFYHALKEQEMSENFTRARFKIVDLLREFSKEYPDADKLVKPIISIIVDGELVYNFNAPNTIFYTSLENQVFGQLFHIEALEPLWDSKLVNYIIKNLVQKKDYWRNEFQIGYEDLLEPERIIYEEYLKSA